MENRRVVVTGIGAVSPLGNNANSTWESMKAGRSGINLIESMDTSEYPVKIGGEIRDFETASIAINASLTGHLVFSTLHTNDAPSAVARMADIGVKKFLIASAVRSIMAQRLIRKICPDCITAGKITEKEIRALRLTQEQLDKAEIKQGSGCRTCRMTGHKGRMGLFEIFNITEEVRLLINGDESSSQLRKRARELGMRTLREDGVRKVLAGTTTPSEVIRVTMADAD